jgi:hypothetical protein
VPIEFVGPWTVVEVIAVRRSVGHVERFCDLPPHPELWKTAAWIFIHEEVAAGSFYFAHRVGLSRVFHARSVSDLCAVLHDFEAGEG